MEACGYFPRKCCFLAMISLAYDRCAKKKKERKKEKEEG